MRPRTFPVVVTIVLLWTIVGRGADGPQELFDKARASARAGNSAEAVMLLDKVIAADPDFAGAFYERGREHFRLGKVEKSVEDFDTYVKLNPNSESRQWERGISMYYAKQYARGAKQFEMYQTFEGNDVENAVWRYLCMAKSDGVEKARAALLPITNDRRVPMMQVYEMFRGNLKPDEVLEVAKRDAKTPEALEGRLFYAHLYLGLFFDAAGDAEQAKKYVRLAAQETNSKNRNVNPYMWDVARIHANLIGK